MIVTLDEMKSHLNVTFPDDDVLIQSKIDAAQSLIESELGFLIETQYPTTVPPALMEAVKQTAAHFYENREAVISGTIVAEMPISATDIIRSFRNWSFG